MHLKRRAFLKLIAAGTLATVAQRPMLALANKAAITISAPDTALKGSLITITLDIAHKGNNFIHYTNWVNIKAGDKEIARWDFSAFNRPEGENFTREVSLPMKQTTELVAEANCNLHGSEGKAFQKVIVINP